MVCAHPEGKRKEMMMFAKGKIAWEIVMLSAGILVLTGVTGAFGEKIREFSADNVTLDANGHVKQRSRIYMRRDMTRSDMPLPSGRLMIIYRRDKGGMRPLRDTTPVRRASNCPSR